MIFREGHRVARGFPFLPKSAGRLNRPSTAVAERKLGACGKPRDKAEGVYRDGHVCAGRPRDGTYHSLLKHLSSPSAQPARSSRYFSTQ